MLTLIDEFSRKRLTIHCARRIGSIQVTERLANAMVEVYRNIFEVIMAQNLLLRSCADGYPALVSKPPTLNQGALGKMAFVKALTAPLEITFWMGRSFIA